MLAPACMWKYGTIGLLSLSLSFGLTTQAQTDSIL